MLRRLITPLTIVTAVLLAARADAASVSAPDVVFSGGASGTFTIEASGAPAVDGYTGVDLVLRYDSDIAYVTGVSLGAVLDVALPPYWDYAYNIVEDVAPGGIDELRISAASSGAMDVAGSGSLFDITFSVAKVVSPTTIPVTFELAELNELPVGAATGGTLTNGSITVGGTDATVALSVPPPPSYPGTTITVTVVDADLAGAGSVTATVINTVTSESEQLLLATESPAGTFTGTLATEFSAAAGTDDDGTLGVKAGDLVSAEVIDALAADGTAKTVSAAPGGQVTFAGGTTAILADLTPTILYPGDIISVQLTDPGLSGSVFVDVTVTDPGNPGSGDTELLELIETSPGVFAADLLTAFDAADAPSGTGDGTVVIRQGDLVSVSYDDQYNDLGGPETVSPAGGDLTVLGGVTGVLTLSPTSLSPGTPLTVEVTDTDLTGTGSLFVTVENLSTGETELIELIEVLNPGPTGTFSLDLSTFYEDGVPPPPIVDNNGTLGIKTGDIVTATYADARDADGGPQDITPDGGDLTIIGGNDGTVAIAPASITPGQDVTVTVVDADLIGSVDVTVRSRTSGGAEKETVTATLTPTSNPNEFSGTISTVFGVAVSAGGGLDVQKDDTIEAEYFDALMSDGSSTTVISPTPALVLGGADGALTVSLGVQAGDGLRIQLADSDLDATGAPDQVDVTVTNATGGDVETVTLTETGNSTGVFRIDPPMTTNSGTASPDGILQVSPQDAITVSYDDVLDALGGPTTVVANVTGVLWGDTSKNGTVRALDAALILQENVDIISFDAYQTLVGDVQPGGLNAADAVLVLQYSVGLITAFPAQTGVPVPHPYKRLDVTRRLAVGEPRTVDGRVWLPIVTDDVEGLLAGNLTLAFDAEQVRVRAVSTTASTEGYVVAHRVEDGRVRVAFAGVASRGTGEAPLLDVEVEALGENAAASLRIVEASLNGGQTPAEVAPSAAALALPQAFSLLQNWPNPFNPETQVRYRLAADVPVRLLIYDMTGQQVAVLVDEQQAAGSYSVRWDGRNAVGQAVATGIYFYRLEAGDATLTRKMSLVR